MIFVQKGFWIRLVVYISSWIVYSDYRAEKKEGRSFMKRLTILCAALTAAMFMNMSAYAETSEVAAEASSGTVCLPGADLTDVMGSGSIFSGQHPEITDPEYYLKEWYNSPEKGEQSILNAHGEYKTPYNNYMDEAYPLLQELH